MTTIALPAFLLDPASFELQLVPVQRSHGSPFGGSEQVADMLNDRWTASASIPPRTKAAAGAVEAFVSAMRGLVNTVNLYHLARPRPAGSISGTPTTISNPAAQGADSILIAAAVGATLLAGDMIGISGLLLQVAADCAADLSGNIEVPLANRLRKAIPQETSVILDRPSAPFRLASTAGIQYVPGYAESTSFDFVEAIT